MRLIFQTLAFYALITFAAVAQEAVYVIRHTEKELSGSDPAITLQGQARAVAWAEMLEHAGLDVVFTSDAKRSQQTGDIIAKRLGLPILSVNRANTTELVDALGFDHEEDRVLIVGHTETIPGILSSLGAYEGISINQSDFANLYILLQPGADASQLIRLRMP